MFDVVIGGLFYFNFFFLNYIYYYYFLNLERHSVARLLNEVGLFQGFTVFSNLCICISLIL